MRKFSGEEITVGSVGQEIFEFRSEHPHSPQQDGPLSVYLTHIHKPLNKNCYLSQWGRILCLVPCIPSKLSFTAKAANMGLFLRSSYINTIQWLLFWSLYDFLEKMWEVKIIIHIWLGENISIACQSQSSSSTVDQTQVSLEQDPVLAFLNMPKESVFNH